MKLSYCISTLNRSELLDNSLNTLTKQTFPKEEFEVIIVDDNSDDGVRSISEKYKGKINIRYIRLEHGIGWRDCATGLNFALRRAQGEVWAAAHPEIVMSPEGLDILYFAHFDKYPLIFQQSKSDKENLCLLMPALFLDEDKFRLEDYSKFPYIELVEKYVPGTDSKIKNIKGYGNFVCMSMKKSNWEKLGGLYEFNSWGSVDPDNQARRDVMGIADTIVDTIHGHCLHQFHPLSVQADAVKKGKLALESRPFGEAERALKNLTQEHEESRKGELVVDEYWALEKI